jgi:hypothetical protein
MPIYLITILVLEWENDKEKLKKVELKMLLNLQIQEGIILAL